jgi:hypothetical protein
MAGTVIVCTGRGTHPKTVLDPQSSAFIQDFDGPAGIGEGGPSPRPWRQGQRRQRQPRFTHYFCEQCGSDKRFGRRAGRLLWRAEDEFGEVDISRLPF